MMGSRPVGVEIQPFEESPGAALGRSGASPGKPLGGAERSAGISHF